MASSSVGASGGGSATTSSTGGSGGSGGGSATTSSTGGSGGAGRSACVPVDDSNPCTEDVCENDTPVHQPLDGVACDDGDACTRTDTCQAGACIGGDPVVCSGNERCVAGACVLPACTVGIGLPGPPQLPTTLGYTETQAAVLGDVNGDGQADLVVANWVPNRVTLLLNQGHGTFGAPVDIAEATSDSKVAIADLNGDGALDLVVTNHGITAGTGVAAVLLNQGQGTFAAPVHYPVGNAPYLVTAADLNGDGSPDLAIVNSGVDGSVEVLLNQGNGVFSAPVDYPAGVSVLMNRGHARFSAPIDYPSVRGASLVATDLNGDHKPDLAVASDYSVHMLLNHGDGTFADPVDYLAARAYLAARPTSIVAADVNADGRMDIAIADKNGLGVLINTCRP